MIRTPPSLSQRVEAAIYVAVYGPENLGVRTKNTLMWPYTEYEHDYVRKEAAHFLANVYTALLKALPPHESDLILKELAEHLSFALGDG